MIYAAQTQEPVGNVQHFYATTLKNLGWKTNPHNPNLFVRHLEQVELSFTVEGRNTKVTFTFKPCS